MHVSWNETAQYNVYNVLIVDNVYIDSNACNVAMYTPQTAYTMYALYTLRTGYPRYTLYAMSTAWTVDVLYPIYTLNTIYIYIFVYLYIHCILRVQCVLRQPPKLFAASNNHQEYLQPCSSTHARQNGLCCLQFACLLARHLIQGLNTALYTL